MAERDQKDRPVDLSTAADKEGVFTVQEATEKGYFGTVMEDEPNESFTVAGVIKKGPMETQEDTAAQPAKAPAKKTTS